MYTHIPVLLNETIKFLDCKKGKIYIDCTLGLGGHSEEILKNIGCSGKLIAIDCDNEAIEAAKKRITEYKDTVIFVHDNFSNLKEIMEGLKITEVDGILFDLGVSSLQFDKKNRGFSFQEDAFLDMRMDKRCALTASHIVNNFSREEIEDIIYKYGEEKYASAIAKNIVQYRTQHPINTTLQLVSTIQKVIPHRYYSKIHFATRTFQALRIAVNSELKNLEQSLRQGIELLKKGGKIVVISFHSLEDRIVKNTFRQFAGRCTCPKLFPVCRCETQKYINILTKKPVLATEKEVQDNIRSRSAKLRAAEKI